MITLKLNTIPTLFIQAFTPPDAHTIIEFVREANAVCTNFSNTILFIDTPATTPLVECVRKLKAEGYRVVFRDHHGLKGTPANSRDKQKSLAIAKLETMLGNDCHVTLRELHPACSTLVTIGEFKNALAIIADPDADGLTAAMKASGIYYDGLDDDAARLDGEPALQVTGTDISQLLAKGIVTLPSYDPQKPKEREQAQQQLFSRWVAAVQGDQNASALLQEGVAAYDSAVAIARTLAERAREVAPGVTLVDVTDSAVFDPATLLTNLEINSQCKITVLRKDKGPIAAIHDIQYSLSVCKSYQEKVDLRLLLPPGAKNDPEQGVISNVSFLLHVNQRVWEEHVLPSLKQQ